MKNPEINKRKMVVIYDDQCRFCQGSVQWIQRRALPGYFEFIGCMSPERSRRFPQITTRDCQTALQLILPDNTVLAGAVALPEILTGLQGWRWLEKLLRTHIMTRIAPFVYQYIAQHRQFISCVIYK